MLGLDRVVVGDFLFDAVAEMVKHLEKRHRAGLAKAAQRGRPHLLAEQFDIVEIKRRIEAAPHLVEGVAHQHGAHPAGRAGAARLFGGLFHVVVKPVDQADLVVEDEETAIAEERPDCVAVVEFVKLFQFREGGFARNPRHSGRRERHRPIPRKRLAPL